LEVFLLVFVFPYFLRKYLYLYLHLHSKKSKYTSLVNVIASIHFQLPFSGSCCVGPRTWRHAPSRLESLGHGRGLLRRRRRNKCFTELIQVLAGQLGEELDQENDRVLVNIEAERLNGHFDIALEQPLGVHAPGAQKLQEDHVGVGVLRTVLGLVPEQEHVEWRRSQLVAHLHIADG